MIQSTLTMAGSLLLALYALPAGAVDYQVVIISCDTGNCQVVETQLPGHGNAKANYRQNDLAIEIEPLSSGRDNVDARVSLHVKPAGALNAAAHKSTETIVAGMGSMVRMATLNRQFFSQLLSYSHGGNSYLVWGRLGSDR